MPPSKPRLHWYTVRPGFVATVCVALLGLWLFYRHYHPPVGSGPAGAPVPAEPFARPWSQRQVMVVGVGDSVVVGFGARRGYGVFDRLVSNPPDDAGDMAGKTLSRVLPKLAVVKIANNSTSSGDHLRYQLPLLQKQASDVFGIVVVSTGGIDLIHDYGDKPPRDEAVYGAPWPDAERYAAAFRQRLEALLDGLASRFPGGSEIFVATIFDPTDGVGDIDHVDPVLRLWKPLPLWPDGLRTLAAFNTHIREAAAARPHVHVVDVHGTLLGHGLHCRDARNPSYHPDDPTYWLYFNLEDPNERGYDALRRAFLLEMVKVLPERLGAPA
jgi:hypothetical protein